MYLFPSLLEAKRVLVYLLIWKWLHWHSVQLPSCCPICTFCITFCAKYRNSQLLQRDYLERNVWLFRRYVYGPVENVCSSSVPDMKSGLHCGAYELQIIGCVGWKLVKSNSHDDLHYSRTGKYWEKKRQYGANNLPENLTCTIIAVCSGNCVKL